MKKIIITLLIFSFSIINIYAQDDNVLTLNQFITQASKNDLSFQEILIEKLGIKYAKYLTLPVKDWVLSLKSNYDTIIEGTSSSGTDTGISLSKLFPSVGSNISVSYNKASYNDESSLELSIAQPIAENAFGKSYSYLEKIAGLEEDLALYQIIEAYEDYLASLITLYYNWYFAYQNLQTAENSYKESLKQLDNIKARKKNRIALDIDVNKIKLQVLSKKERVIASSDKLNQKQNLIIKSLSASSDFNMIPEKDLTFFKELKNSFEKEYKIFKYQSRTSKTIGLLLNKSKVNLDKYYDALLPSANLNINYLKSNSNSQRASSSLTAGISIELPYKAEQDKASYEISKINNKKASIYSQNKHIQLYTDLLNLYTKIEKTYNLIQNAEETILLAESILKDEQKNYTLGQATLNDLIIAVNKIEDTRFSKIEHSVQLKLLITEWFRLTDQLVKEK